MFFMVAIVLAVQTVVLVGIVFFLKRALHNDLLETTVQEFEITSASRFDENITEVVVTHSRPLSARLLARIRRAVDRKFGEGTIVTIKKDDKIKGGLILKVRGVVIDGSLLHRLKESGWAK